MAEATCASEVLPLSMAPHRKPLGLSFWLPIIWIALVMLLALAAPYGPFPDPDRIDWDHPASPPGTRVTS
ncbi:MAG: hypothetical protein R3311_21240, partial [Oceanisphaera sp.]|nr:hypothetical protein [Oceanisphaera sp.]